MIQIINNSFDTNHQLFYAANSNKIHWMVSTLKTDIFFFGFYPLPLSPIFPLSISLSNSLLQFTAAICRRTQKSAENSRIEKKVKWTFWHREKIESICAAESNSYFIQMNLSVVTALLAQCSFLIIFISAEFRVVQITWKRCHYCPSMHEIWTFWGSFESI